MQTFQDLDPTSLRVLGSLMEKEMTTPDLYPLTLNTLQSAANQRSSREPVMTLAEHEVRSGLSALEAHALVAVAQGSRVLRYEHRIRTVLTLRRDETAILCLLLLRGPQTAGELRSRADRMFPFDDLGAVQTALERLAARESPLVQPLPRSPGSREVRWAHRLGDPALQPAAAETTNEAVSPPGDLRAELMLLAERVSVLESQVALLLSRSDTTQPQEITAPMDDLAARSVL